MADLTTITLTPSNPYLRSPPPITTPTPTTTTPETDTETPPTKPTTDHHHHHHSKILSFTNGSLKNHHHHHHQNHQLTTPRVVVYKECLKNHAASLGGHALDGCGEFMPLSTATATDPTSLKCSACGCHRNFHRREPKEGCGGGGGGGAATQIIDFQAHHQIPTPTKDQSPTNSFSPPPISPTYYQSSAPHMLLALSAGLSRPSTKMTKSNPIMGNGGRKRFRSKFSQEQKEKMYCFSEKVGWKIQKRDEGIVEEFCNEVGIGKNVLKVWMHNNKYTFGKRDFNGTSSSHVVTNGLSSSS